MSNFASQSGKIKICARSRSSRFSVENISQIFFREFLAWLNQFEKFYGIVARMRANFPTWCGMVDAYDSMTCCCFFIVCFALLIFEYYGPICMVAYILGWTVCHMQIPKSKANSSVCSNLVYVLYSMCFFYIL